MSVNSSNNEPLENCVICFDDIKEEDQYITPCNHIFHLSCVKKQMKSECALCRGPLPDNMFTNKSSDTSDLITTLEQRISTLLDNRNNNTDVQVILLLDIINDLRRGIFNLGLFLEVRMMQANSELQEIPTINYVRPPRFVYNNTNETPSTSNILNLPPGNNIHNTNETTLTNDISNTVSTSSTNTKISTIQCSGITKKGKQCLRKTKDDLGLCYNHR